MTTLTTAEKLAAAEEALHALLIGGQEVEVQYENTRIKYTQANIEELRRYIALLKGEDDTTKRRRPFGVAW